jgi:adhesin transport system membrane fusion protein
MHEDLEFVSDLNAAVREQVHGGARVLMYTCIATVIWALYWASGAKLDEVAHGFGKIIPVSKVQVVGSLEGGIASEILVNVGDVVEKDQILLKIDNKRGESSYQESSTRLGELRMRQARLGAEVANRPFVIDRTLARTYPEMARSEEALYRSNIDLRDNLLRINESQVEQRRQEIKEGQSHIKSLLKSLQLIDDELVITRPLVLRRVVSKVEQLRLQRDEAGVKERLVAVRETLPRLLTSLSELEYKKTDIRMTHIAKSQKDLSDTLLETTQLEKIQLAQKDQLTRTVVRAPIKGIVKQLFVHTIGGVIKPTMDLVEIVPVDDNLLVEVRVNPADIAFIHVGQSALVKVTAYDFAIYGGFPGKVVNVGADSQEDERQQIYFPVRIKTEQNYLRQASRRLSVMPGMTVSADILTGKKTVLQYLLKPILKAKQNALTER